MSQENAHTNAFEHNENLFNAAVTHFVNSNGCGRVYKRGQVSMLCDLVACLKPNELMDGEFVDAALARLENVDHGENVSVFFSTLVAPMAAMGASNMFPMLDALAQARGLQSIFDASALVIPCVVDSSWLLVAIRPLPGSRSVNVYHLPRDDRQAPPDLACVASLLNFLESYAHRDAPVNGDDVDRAAFGDPAEYRNNVSTHTPLNLVDDGFNCGIFVLAVAHRLAHQLTPPHQLTQADLDTHRRILARAFYADSI